MKNTSSLPINKRLLASYLAVCTVLIVISLCYTMEYAVAAVENHIRGQGFGNNGLRFSSFVDCGDGTKLFFSGGSRLLFSSKFQDKPENVQAILGSWQIQLLDSDKNMTSLRGGILTHANITDNNYYLSGLELENDACNQGLTTIEISGKCLDESPIHFKTFDKSRVGSITPNDRDPVYSFYGSKIKCEVVNNNFLMKSSEYLPS
jgi:hypothetical protein